MTPRIHELIQAMAAQGYIADEALATAIHLADALGKPLLIEGEAGVGKTEIAKTVARVRGTELIRLQCYEGLDVTTAVYEWNYPRQMLRVRLSEAEGRSAAETEETIFSRAYLLERPLLRALTRLEGPAVLLIDEIDRADEAFEAFLLELLSDFQVTIPELGTVRALHVPAVFLTSNATRELGDALRRRCLYHYLDHPTLEKETWILRSRVPEAADALARQVAAFVQRLRTRPLARVPGVAESIDWARALARLARVELDTDTVAATLGCLIKDRRDGRELDAAELARMVDEARAS